MMRLPVLATLLTITFSATVFGQESRGVLYDFTAVWCAPCQQMAPIVEKLQREGLPIQKIDIDQQRELAGRFQVQQVPSFVLVIDGKEADRVTGRMTESDLRRMVAKIPAPQPDPARSGAVATNPQRSSGLIPIELGQAAPLVRPAPIQTTAREEIRTAEAEQKRGLRDLIPFGRKEKTPEAAPIVRGNDSSLGESELFQTSTRETAAPADPMNSSVRIRVITNGRIDLGSGTVISSQQGISRILTCAHIFKGFNDDSRIEVDLFENGRPNQYLAKFEKSDATSDVGLISIPTTSIVPAVRVAPVEHNPKVGDTVAAIGCSGGEEPTRQQSRITDIDKYEGPHNLLCIGVPVRGRSGGGLFNGHGEVVGVCSAADEPAQRGFYSGLLAVHKLLDECSLSQLYRPVAPAQATPSLFASTENVPQTMPETPRTQEAAPAGFPTSFSASQTQGLPQGMGSMAGGAAPSSLDVQAGGAEVVVIIRDPQQPNAPNRVVILHQASPKFLSYLSGELKEGAIDTNLLGATSPEHMPEIARSQRADEMHHQVKQSLQPTTMSRPVIPKKYSRAQ